MTAEGPRPGVAGTSWIHQPDPAARSTVAQMAAVVASVVVVLADVGVRPVVELAGRRQGVVAKDEPELLSDLTVAGQALLPAGAADRPDDRVDLLDDVLDDHGPARRRVFGQDLRERTAIRIEDLERIEPTVRLRPLGTDELTGEFEVPLAPPRPPLPATSCR